MKFKHYFINILVVGLIISLIINPVRAQAPTQTCWYVKVNGIDNGSSVCLENTLSETGDKLTRTVRINSMHVFDNESVSRGFLSEILMRFERINNTEAGNRTNMLFRQSRGWNINDQYYHDTFDTNFGGLMFFKDNEDDGYLNRSYYNSTTKYTDTMYLGGIMNFTDLQFEIIPITRLGQEFIFKVTFIQPIISITNMPDDNSFTNPDVLTTTNITMMFHNYWDNATLKTTMIQKISMGPLTNTTMLQRFPSGFSNYSMGIYYYADMPGNSTYIPEVQNQTYVPTNHEIVLKEKNTVNSSFSIKMGGNYTVGGNKSNAYEQNVTVFPPYSFSNTDAVGRFVYMIGFSQWDPSLALDMDPIFEVNGAPFPFEVSPKTDTLGIAGFPLPAIFLFIVALIPILYIKEKKKIR